MPMEARRTEFAAGLRTRTDKLSAFQARAGLPSSARDKFLYSVFTVQLESSKGFALRLPKAKA